MRADHFYGHVEGIGGHWVDELRVFSLPAPRFVRGLLYTCHVAVMRGDVVDEG